jgi:hypothetical protein
MMTSKLLMGLCLAMSQLVWAQSSPGPAPAAGAPDPALQAFGAQIAETFEKQNGGFVCSGEHKNVQSIAELTLRFLKAGKPQGPIDSNMTQAALYSLFPCPFSPYRKELAPATEQDVMGAWVFPQASQRFRSPPRLNIKPPTAPDPVVCEGLGFFEQGEHRRLITGGKSECAAKSVASFKIERAKPVQLSWRMIEKGRMAVSSKANAKHIEEWDALLVKSSFEQYGVKYMPGDLIMYLRKTADNQTNIAIEFRHLQKLN